VVTFNPEFRELRDYLRKGDAAWREDLLPDCVNLFTNGWIHDVLISVACRMGVLDKRF